MIFECKKYTIQLDEKGAIVSLVSGGKQFAKKRLPLFALQLRNGGDTEKFTSDDAKNIEKAIENNLKILDQISEKYGVKTIKSLKSFWNDESVFIIFMKRHVIHTSAELVLDEAAKESKSDENNKSDSKS